ncbi:hypothetical protein [Paenibacillus cremeus]|uniref:Uncharacterized protein n=1 Tax=Paenibacillus cremeus TaxID=2163881 RepID=A0A559JZX7_9BACL|nr:hypothetical protein [Paenibacillus cremeus]TVY05438.1 hypothetical protein FPZ49_30425 [Paenibacillus cremeus]
MIRRVISLAALMAFLLCNSAGKVSAHNFNNGYTYMHLFDNSVELEQLFPFPVMLQYDTNGNQQIEKEELAKQRASIESYVLSHLKLYSREQPMEGRVESIQTIIQEQTEDPMVRIMMTFTSPLPVEDLTIHYAMIFDDVDEAHQNYMVLYDAQDQLLEHWVVEKGTGLVHYSPSDQFRFNLPLIGDYIVLGAQQMLYSGFCWLLLAFLMLTAPTFQASCIALGNGILYTLLGVIAMDRLGTHSWAIYIHSAAAVLAFGYAGYMMFTGRGVYPRVLSALFGTAWGTGSVSLLSQLHLNPQFKVISLLFFYLGVALAWGGGLYVLYFTIEPLLRSRRLKQRAQQYFWRKRLADLHSQK